MLKKHNVPTIVVSLSPILLEILTYLRSPGFLRWSTETAEVSGSDNHMLHVLGFLLEGPEGVGGWSHGPHLDSLG